MADPAPQPLVPAAPGSTDMRGRQLGRYEVLHMLASGGMASVYVARAQGVAGFERLVAIKVLHPHIAHDEDFISMFLDEARLAARLRHPNAVGTLDISDTQGDGYFLVMEYVEGDHFGHLLRSAAKGGSRLPVPVVARIVMDGLAGLQAAHELTDTTGAPLDLVHRDVSPHNLLVGSDGVARITDFGIAKAQVRLSSTRDGQFKGKLSYMAPEQAASGMADQRSDLFSVGIVLWEALTGRRLFRGENNADVLNKILNPNVPPPSRFDETLTPFDAVIARALAREPKDRFQTAEEFLDAVEEAARSLGGVATPRAVSKEVNLWLGDKIERERAALRAAIEASGRSELTPGVLPRPMESGSQPTTPSQVRARDDLDLTVGAKPSKISVPPRRRSRLPIVLAVVASGLIGGIAGAWVLLGGGDEVDPSGPVAGPPSEASAGSGPAAAGPTDGDETSDETSDEATAEPARVAAPGEEPTAGEATADRDLGDDDPDRDLGDDAEGHQEASDEGSGRSGRRRGRRRRRAEAAEEPAGEPAATPASPEPRPEPRDPRPPAGGDDDLMLNPYR